MNTWKPSFTVSNCRIGTEVRRLHLFGSHKIVLLKANPDIYVEPAKLLTFVVCMPSDYLTSIAHRAFQYGFVFALRKHSNRPSAKPATKQVDQYYNFARERLVEHDAIHNNKIVNNSLVCMHKFIVVICAFLVTREQFDFILWKM